MSAGCVPSEEFGCEAVIFSVSKSHRVFMHLLNLLEAQRYLYVFVN